MSGQAKYAYLYHMGEIDLESILNNKAEAEDKLRQLQMSTSVGYCCGHDASGKTLWQVRLSQGLFEMGQKSGKIQPHEKNPHINFYVHTHWLIECNTTLSEQILAFRPLDPSEARDDPHLEDPNGWLKTLRI